MRSINLCRVAGEAAATSGPDAPSDRVQDRCRGTMIGLAAGNLLGVPAEGWPRGAIRRRYPDGIREIETGPEQPDDYRAALTVNNMTTISAWRCAAESRPQVAFFRA